MERKFKFTEGGYYHLYNRGVNKGDIFLDANDWVQFQKLLFFRNDKEGKVKASRLVNKPLFETERGETLVDICAYALMPNHFHLLVKEKSEGGISKFMAKLQTSFSKYINIKHDRSGPLLGRPFQAQYVDNDDYMRWLISYIHLNPLSIEFPGWKEDGVGNHKKAWEYLNNYTYSSYQDYFSDDRDESMIISKESLPFFISDLEDVAQMYDVYMSKESLRTPL